jgi:hypothetical protein
MISSTAPATELAATFGAGPTNDHGLLVGCSPRGRGRHGCGHVLVVQIHGHVEPVLAKDVDRLPSAA